MKSLQSTGAEKQPDKVPTAGRARPWLWLLLALGIFVGVIFYLGAAEDSIDVQQIKTPPPVQLVSVEPLRVGAETVEVASFAEVRPRWAAELRAAVSGRVLKVTEQALTGERVDAGTLLVEIEHSRYRAELTAAEQALKQATLDLAMAEKATKVARRQFRQAGKTPPNDLALHLPQLEIAKSAVQAAEARLIASRQQLQDAQITAPFSGFITRRFVSPGQSVNVGESIVKLVDDTTFELTVELGPKDWRLLKQPLAGQQASVYSQDGEQIATATVRQAGGFLDETTRQYKVFLEVTDAAPEPLLSGDFVRVRLPGISVAAALNIPASALTQEGYIWHVDADNRLQRQSPRVLFRRQDRIIVESPAAHSDWQVVITPLASFLPGQSVRPQAARS